MGRVSSTHFNPALGVRYLIKNKKTGETKVAKALGIHDKAFAPIRSNKDTPKGKEFFKMLLNDKPIKFLNSLNYSECLSEDRTWEFIGQRPDGSEMPKKHTSKSEAIDIIEFASDEYKQIMETV